MIYVAGLRRAGRRLSGSGTEPCPPLTLKTEANWFISFHFRLLVGDLPGKLVFEIACDNWHLLSDSLQLSLPESRPHYLLRRSQENSSILTLALLYELLWTPEILSLCFANYSSFNRRPGCPSLFLFGRPLSPLALTEASGAKGPSLLCSVSVSRSRFCCQLSSRDRRSHSLCLLHCSISRLKVLARMLRL